MRLLCRSLQEFSLWLSGESIFVKIECFKIIFKKNNSYYVQREGLSEEEVIEAVLEGVHSQTVVTAGILLVALR